LAPLTAAMATAATVLLASCAPAPAPVVQQTSAFVTVRGDRLFEGKEEFRFLSFSVPNLHYIEDDLRFAQAMPFRWPIEYEVRDALDSIRQMGGRVVRIGALSVRKADDPADLPRHVLGPVQFDDHAFETLDMVLEVARAKGVRLIIPLVDNWSRWGGVTEYAAFRGKPPSAFWSDPQVMDDYKQTVRFVLERVNTRNQVPYRDDPTILAWETGNELHCPQRWTSEIAAYMKELDPNHLVIDGRHEQVLLQSSLDDPNVDVLQTHHYESDPREMIANIRQSAAVARGHRPYILGEFGFLTTAGMTAVMDTIIDEGLAGGFVRSLRFHDRDGGFYWHSEPHGDDFFKAYHWPGFASGEAYDETRLLREVRRRAFAVRGIRDPERGAPAAPAVIEVGSGGLVSWRGAAGAGAYDIQRTESLEEAWRTVATGVSDAATQYRPQYSDQSVVPGRRYWYRVIARNDAGRSAPSEAFGPMTMTYHTLVDELWNGSRVFFSAGSLQFRSDQAHRFKEDAHGLTGKRGAAVVYRTDGPIISGRVWAFAETNGDHLRFSVSGDGENFARLDPHVENLGSADTDTFGYWLPIRYRLDDPPFGVRYLRVEFKGAPVRVTRIELDYGE
jgi:hypothetical protein